MGKKKMNHFFGAENKKSRAGRPAKKSLLFGLTAIG
tara:strand:- start:865 stop:972 length:108 start_codon:yes stop_codon:yes gene_type:complete